MLQQNCVKILLSSHQPIRIVSQISNLLKIFVYISISNTARFHANMNFNTVVFHLGSKIFGCPLIATLPRKVTGHHLYKCIGYLLPNTLPMKDRTSFTLHTVNKSGYGCSACSKATCSGCLVRIDDNVNITRDTNVVVHFDDLAEESMKCFGIPNPSETTVSGSRGFFDGILRSCVKAYASDGMMCQKCSNVCKVWRGYQFVLANLPESKKKFFMV